MASLIPWWRWSHVQWFGMEKKVFAYSSCIVDRFNGVCSLPSICQWVPGRRQSDRKYSQQPQGRLGADKGKQTSVTDMKKWITVPFQLLKIIGTPVHSHLIVPFCQAGPKQKGCYADLWLTVPDVGQNKINNRASREPLVQAEGEGLQGPIPPVFLPAIVDFQ